MKDKFGREITYLRISLTDRCNFRCLYCMPKDGVELLPHDEILSIEEIGVLVDIFTSYGIKYVRLTGGEPLIRKGFFDLLDIISQNKKIEDVSLTTNGYFLKEMVKPLREKGVKRINISLDSLRPEVFKKITRIGDLDRVIEGIHEAKMVGFSPIKLNTVIMRGINEDEVVSLVEFARDNGLEIRFIELMPNNHINGNFKELFVSNDQIKKKIGQAFVPREKTGWGPEDTYILEDGTKIGFIGAITHNFCASCNRIRVTSTGRLNPCLMSPLGIDLKPGLRPLINKKKLHTLIQKALFVKPEGHSETDFITNMNAIGG